jgi:protein-disulfide isomerase
LVGATLTAGVSVALLHLVVAVLFVVDAQRDRVAAQLRPIVTDPAFVQWHHGQREQHDIPIDPQRPLIGNSDAAHTAVLFVDYLCGACRGASALLGKLAAEHPDRLRVAYRHFPQNAACNPAYEQNFHPGSCEAAIAGEAAWEAGGAAAFHAMTELLYDRQARIRPETPFEYWAAELDLDTRAFQQAAANPELAARVAADAALGAQLGVARRGPPGIFLDGQLVVYWNNAAAWRALLGLPAAAESHEAVDPPDDE